MTSVAHARGGPAAHGDAHHAPMSFWRKYIFSTDHKIIGIQFLFVSLFFLLVGGLLAMQMRWQLAYPGQPMPGGVILPEYYIQLVTMHVLFLMIRPPPRSPLFPYTTPSASSPAAGPTTCQ